MSDAKMKLLLKSAEEQRRERPSLDCVPLKNSPVMDYGQSGTTMELAMGHLRESIPNGQRLRTEYAWRALRVAVEEQEQWLRAKGYAV